jgi:hypothetical protein
MMIMQSAAAAASKGGHKTRLIRLSRHALDAATRRLHRLHHLRFFESEKQHIPCPGRNCPVSLYYYFIAFSSAQGSQACKLLSGLSARAASYR